ncbi:MAG TPA: T9SS type A sorting domain-containing protein [Flavipsychrobacter sp.]|nr:T9SS type A sorting domain-containing protein [Flavipsychrobacter sp.]
MRTLFLFIAIVISVSLKAQPGCTDPLATNYNNTATINDGSCVYAPATVTPYNIKTLSDTVAETSGLVRHNNYLWTHNDNSDLNLYALDTATGQIMQTVSVQNVTNYDWEDITQDSNYFYVGDFGNNGNGNRTDLHILRISKASLSNGTVLADTIRFSYSDQTDFSGSGANNTDYDCEAFIATDDSLYLFTKQWVSKKTSVYVLPKTPSSSVYIASLKHTHDVQGMITAATYLADKKTIVLTGYNLNPFVYLLYDFNSNNFFSGNKRKIDIVQPFSQIEAIATQDGKSFFITNEKLVQLNIPARLQKIDLTSYLNPYYQTAIASVINDQDVVIYPNPAVHSFSISINAQEQSTVILKLTDVLGKIVFVQQFALSTGANKLMVKPNVAAGLYNLTLKNKGGILTKKLSFK